MITSSVLVDVDFAFLVYVLFGFSVVIDAVSAGAGTETAFLLVLLLGFLPLLAGVFFSLPVAFLSALGASAATSFSVLGFLPTLLLGFAVSDEAAELFSDFEAAAALSVLVLSALGFLPALLLGFSVDVSAVFLGCSDLTLTGAEISADVSALLFFVV